MDWDKFLGFVAVVFVVGFLFFIAFILVHTAEMEKAGFVYRSEWVKVR
jgi:hypothetical protein